MSKVFTWIFGAITGIMAGFAGGIGLIAYCMVIDPENFVRICNKHIKE